MTRILVTGGNGGLGRELTPRLIQTGYTVRVMSRQPRPATIPIEVEWATADLETDTGLREAVTGVDTIIHAASSPFNREQQVDIEGTRRILEIARAAKVKHFVHVSIVGIERIPWSYYQAKVAAEAVVRSGGLPYSILRATQFHSLIDYRLGMLTKFPITFIPTDFKFQTMDTGEAADRLVQIVGDSPAGLLPDLGGPEVLTFGEMAKAWFAAQGKRAWLVRVPMLGAMAHSFRNGYNTCPNQRDGKITWRAWVQEKYAKRSAPTRTESHQVMS